MTSTMQEAAGQKPVPSVNPAVNPAAAGPVLPSPPHPVLQSAGFAWGGIDEFNQRIQGVVDAYQDAHGERPPAGLALDVARSKVQPTDYDKLFQTHLANPFDAQLTQQVKGHQTADPHNWSVVRPDGKAEPNTPTRQLVVASDPVAARTLQVAHPYIPTGYVPLPTDQATAFQQAVIDQQKTGDVLHGGQTLQQYANQVQQGQGPYGPGFQATRNVRDIRTVQQAQDSLKKLAPDFFGTLQSTGYMSPDWGSAYVRWTKSQAYAHTSTVNLATQNGFGTNTGKFIQAWNWQNEAIAKHPDEAPLLRALPLSWFALVGPDTWTQGHDLGPLANYLTGNTHGWGWLNVPTWSMSILTHGVGLLTDVFGGSLGSAEKDAAAGTAFIQAIAPKGLGGKGQTEEQARAAAAAAIHRNPDILSVFDPGFHGSGAWWDQAANTGFALVLGLGALAGDKVAVGDVAKLVKTSGFNTRTAWAFNALAKGDVGQAAHSLEGGRGAERLVTAAEQGVRDGTINLTQFRQATAELWAEGRTQIGDTELNGAIMASLRTRALHSQGFVGGQLTQMRNTISKIADDFEKTLQRNPELGATNRASSFVSNVRQQFSRATESKAAAFDRRTPENLYNWAVNNLKNRDVASELRNELVRARATDNVSAIAALNDKIRSLYLKANPDAQLGENPFDATGPQVEAESRTYLFFPHSIEQRAGKINDMLNRIGRVDREIIVSGAPLPPPLMVPGFGESLAWKHVVDDTLRRIVGGGGKYDPAVFGRLHGTEAAVAAALRKDPTLVRELGAARAGSILGENRWVTGAQYESATDFTTGEHFADTGRMTAAGMYLRHQLTSKALKAYQASSPDNLEPLTMLVLTDKTFSALAFNNEAWRKITADVKEHYGLAGKERMQTALDSAAQEWAAAYAERLYKTYRGIEKAGEDQGIQNALGQGLDVLIKNVGPKADQALGKWIAANKIDFPVRDPMVIGTKWDSYMQKWIGTLMTANKWNRGKMFDNVFHATVRDFIDAGWQMQDAIPVAADLAQRQVVYHMLDFSNMLHIEQTLRWVAPFMTKHRLYWTWIMKQAVQRPGLAALVYEVGKHLGPNGNVQMQVGGHTLEVPVTRLLWANANGYPQTSPLITGSAGFAKGLWDQKSLTGAVAEAQNALSSTSGNLITRDDQAWALTARLALVSAGTMKATADNVTAGMDQSQAKLFDVAVNEYIQAYFTETGHWPTETQAVKHTLLAETAHTWWNANLFLPIETPSPGATPPKIKTELATYDTLSQAEKYNYLQDHPEVALHFGISYDPAVYLHDQQLWQRFNAVKAVYAAKQKELIAEIEAGRYADVKKQWSQLGLWHDQQIAALRLQDALTWHGTKDIPAGMVSDGMVVVPGPWSKQLDGDPLAMRGLIHQAYPGIPPGQLDAHTIGEEVASLQARADQLRLATTPAAARKLGTTVADAKKQLTQIDQIISPFFSSPKNAGSQLINDYYSKYVTPYIQQRDKLQAFVNNASADQKTQYESDLRAWKDSHDHPVVVNGVTFPSVVQIGWIGLASVTRRQALEGAISGNWQHVADYEKRMMGLKIGPDVSKGWAAYATTIAQYEANPSAKSLVAAQRTALAKQIDKVYPGFYKDYLFSLQPKIYRWQATTLYKQLPDKVAFDQYVTGPAKQIINAIKANGHRDYYSKAWRQYIEQQVVPWLAKNPQLERAMKGYGPNFLNTLISNG